MTVSDCKTTMAINGRCDDGSDDNIASLSIAETDVLKEIGKIDTIRLQVALTSKNAKPKIHKFSRTWIVPSTVLNLLSERLALNNLLFLVPDDTEASEDMLIGRADCATCMSTQRHLSRNASHPSTVRTAVPTSCPRPKVDTSADS